MAKSLPKLVGVVACIAVVAWFLVQYPAATAYLPPAVAVLLAAILAGCLWFTLAPPRGLTTSRLARHVAVGAAVAIGAGLLRASRLDLRGDASGIAGYLFLVPVALLFATSAVTAAVGRSLRAGVQAAVWTPCWARWRCSPWGWRRRCAGSGPRPA